METQLTDRDAEALEAHLDGALPPDASVALCRRLSDEPRLAAALDQMRSERAVRQAVWSSYEPDEAAAEDAAAGALAAAARQERVGNWLRFARRLTTAAAVVAVAFAGGWAARARLSPDQSSRDVRPRAAHRFVTSGGGEGAASYPVPLTDAQGNVTAIRYFDDAGAARKFAEDEGRWQNNERPSEGERFVPASGEF